MKKFKIYLSCLLLSTAGCTLKNTNDDVIVFENGEVVENVERKTEILEAVDGMETKVGECGQYASYINVCEGETVKEYCLSK